MPHRFPVPDLYQEMLDLSGTGLEVVRTIRDFVGGWQTATLWSPDFGNAPPSFSATWMIVQTVAAPEGESQFLEARQFEAGTIRDYVRHLTEDDAREALAPWVDRYGDKT